MTLREKQCEFWNMVAKLILYAKEFLGASITIIEWLRTIDTQRVLVARGASKTMNSKHLKGLAVDVVFIEDLTDDGELNYEIDKYVNLGLFWESIGGTWGGRFGDDPNTEKIDGWDAMHFQYKE